MKRLLVVSLLFLFPIIGILGREYNRYNWRWTKVEGCMNTRHYILKMRHMAGDPNHPLVYKTKKKCMILSGKWKSYFTGKFIYKSSKIDIDHLVPCHYAFKNGAKHWAKKYKLMYANYLRNPVHLVVVESGLNRSKSDKGPTEWLPPRRKCAYIVDFLLVMNEWGLWMQEKELRKLGNLKDYHCGWQ